MQDQTNKQETIAAIATAPGRGGVGVIRISGFALADFAAKLSPRTGLKPRQAHYSRFLDAQGQTIDHGILIYFPTPNSFTGEDVLELQAHGSPVVLRMLLQRCFELGARPAEAGEFSKRAFLNNKIDLAQAESIADLIDAGSRAAARMAMRSLQGVFSKQINTLVEELIDLRILVEGSLDFPDEGIDFLQQARVTERIDKLIKHLKCILRQSEQGAMLREGMHVILVGAPNVGKSSLLNALTGEDSAIVTDIAGTTRDMIRETITIDDIPIHIIDTAGLRETEDRIEKIGIERSREAIKRADLALVLIDPQEGLNSATAHILASLPPELKRIEIHNKIDLRQQQPHFYPHSQHCLDSGASALIKLSAKTGAGIDLLQQQILTHLGWQGETEGLFLARARHIEALKRAYQELLHIEEASDYTELVAEHLRNAQDALNEITGRFSADDLLGAIFSRFCIGK